MANAFVTLPVPPTNGIGAAQDASVLGQLKTITIRGKFVGTIYIEFSCGGSFKPLVAATAEGKYRFPVASKEMRVRRANTISGQPTIEVGSDNPGGKCTQIPADGSSVDVSDFGTFNSVVVGAVPPQSVVYVEISDNDVDWTTCMVFQIGDHQSKEFTAKFMRVRASTGAQVQDVHVCAVNDAASAAMIDEKVKISADDTTSDFLESKLTEGAGITLTKNNVGGDENIEIAAPGSTDELVKVTSNDTTPGFLLSKLQAGPNITLTEINDAGDEKVEISATDVDTVSSLVTWGNRSLGPSTTTRYMSPGSENDLAFTSAIRSYRVPRSGLIRRMYVEHNSAGGNGNTIVYTLHVNGIATALTASLATGATGTASDIANAVAVAAGDKIDMVATKALLVAGGNIDAMVSVEVA